MSSVNVAAMDTLTTKKKTYWLLMISAGLGVATLGAPGCGDGTTNGSTSSSSAGAGGVAGAGGSETGGAGGTNAGGTGGTNAGGAGGAGGTNAGGTGGTNSGGMGGAGGGAAVCLPGTMDALPAMMLTEVVSGLVRPTFVTGAPGDTSRLFILEKPGRIRVVKDGTLLPASFLDQATIVESASNERGLLGLAFHPDYAQNGRFYVYYTRKGDGALEISEYKVGTGTPDIADPASARVLMTIPHPGRSNHNGGMLAFGPDGYLYMGTGDGGGGGDPDENGQDVTAQLGKMLRIDVNNHPTPPPGNMMGGDPYIWDIGMRNPWRFSFDRCTGDLYIGDVGQDAWEEIDIETPGDGHKNYGWDTMEGKHCYEPMNNCDMTGLTMPVVEYSHVNGTPVPDCSVTGGYVYRGKNIPGLVGTYLYADYCTKRIYTLAWAAGNIIKQGEATAIFDSANLASGIVSFGQDTAGEMYVVMDGNSNGKVFRIDPK